MTFTCVMYWLRERQVISSLCLLSITRYKSCAKKKLRTTGNGEMELRRSWKAFRFALSRGTWIKKNFHCYSIICSVISSFYIVTDSARSNRDNYNFVLSSCKLKFLSYYLRQQFFRDLSGNDGNIIGSMMIGIAIDQTISTFRLSIYFRKIFSRLTKTISRT